MKPTFIVLVCAVASPAYAVTVIQPQVDQQHVPPMALGVLNVGDENSVDVAQTFTVGLPGRLTGFDLWVQRSMAVTQPLLYDFRRTEAGVPTESDTGDNILASGTLDAGLFEVVSDSNTTPADLLHIDLEKPFDVQVGDVLSLVLRSDDPSSLSYVWRFGGDAYAGGRSYSRIGPRTWGGFPSSLDGDTVFRTYVVVPEPSSVCLLGFALLVGTARPRRRRRRFQFQSRGKTPRPRTRKRTRPQMPKSSR